MINMYICNVSKCRHKWAGKDKSIKCPKCGDSDIDINLPDNSVVINRDCVEDAGIDSIAVVKYLENKFPIKVFEQNNHLCYRALDMTDLHKIRDKYTAFIDGWRCRNDIQTLKIVK